MIVNCQRRVPLAIGPLKKFLERVRSELRFPSESVTIRLVSDAAMAKLNLAFRGKRGATDVLSFPADENGNGFRTHRESYDHGTAIPAYIGDIAISPETARRNANRYARSLPAELRVLILHGMIHLAGYDHETDHGQMERFERRLRCRFGLD